MSITVADCLNLPALREAKLLAGVAGIHCPVSAISVLEYPDIAIMTRDILAGNELILSALAFIKNNAEDQCRIIRHLHSMGEAGLILYYVGIIVENIDPQVLATADDLNFPLIAMPFGRLDFRYSDVITEVMELVINDRKQDRYFVSGMVTRLAQLPQKNRTMTSALRLLSDRLHCTLLLTDKYLTRKASAAWPVSNQWDFTQILDALKEELLPTEQQPMELYCGKKVWVWNMPITSKKRHNLHLFILDEQNSQKYENLQQAVEVVELYLNVWNQEIDDDELEALVSAILNDCTEQQDRITARLHIDLSHIRNMWMLAPADVSNVTAGINQHQSCLRLLKHFLQEHHKLVLVNQHEGNLIALFDDSMFEESEAALAEEFIQQLVSNNINMCCAVCQSLVSSSQIRPAYQMSKEYLHTAQLIYRSKSVFTLGEIRFAAQCRKILSQGESIVEEKLKCFSKMQDLMDNMDLLKTLSVYLLDADSNTQKTGALLFLHRNTVQYRLNKIRSALDQDLTKMPEIWELYQGLAIRRLLRLD